MDTAKKCGYVISVQGPVVDVKFTSKEDVPDILDSIRARGVDAREIIKDIFKS